MTTLYRLQEDGAFCFDSDSKTGKEIINSFSGSDREAIGCFLTAISNTSKGKFTLELETVNGEYCTFSNTI